MFAFTDIPSQSAGGSIQNVCIYRHTLPVYKWKHLECLYLQICPPSLQAEASIMFASTDIPSQSASGSIDNVCIYRHTLPVCKWKHLECLYLQIYPPSLQVEASRMFVSTDIPSQSTSGSIQNVCIFRHALPVCKWKHLECLYLQTHPPSLQVEVLITFVSTDIPSQSTSGSIQNVCIFRHTLPVCKWKHLECLYLQTHPPSLQVEVLITFVSTDIPSQSTSGSIQNVCIYRYTLPVCKWKHLECLYLQTCSPSLQAEVSRMFVSTDIPSQSASGRIQNVCIYRHTLPVCKWKNLECLYLQTYPPSLQAGSIDNVCIYRHTLPVCKWKHLECLYLQTYPSSLQVEASIMFVFTDIPSQSASGSMQNVCIYRHTLPVCKLEASIMFVFTDIPSQSASGSIQNVCIYRYTLPVCKLKHR